MVPVVRLPATRGQSCLGVEATPITLEMCNELGTDSSLLNRPTAALQGFCEVSAVHILLSESMKECEHKTKWAGLRSNLRGAKIEVQRKIIHPKSLKLR